MSYQLEFTGLLLPQFVAGLRTTVELTVISTVAGLAVGTLCAAGRTSKQAWLRCIKDLYRVNT
ncbi:hypothetical protein P4S64_13095 [Vibrio sp. M60_M31a]